MHKGKKIIKISKYYKIWCIGIWTHVISKSTTRLLDEISSRFQSFMTTFHLQIREDAKYTNQGINVIEMPVRPTLGIIPSGHNNSGAGLLTPLGVGTIVTKTTM
jgi:hypothetical protein